MTTIKVNNKEYSLVYGVKSALCRECLDGLMSFVGATANMDAGEMMTALKCMAELPNMALDLFFGGLIEKHGKHRSGDKSVPNRDAAMEILSDYMNESGATFADVAGLCIKQMEDDRFFIHLGLAEPKKNQEDDEEQQTA